MTTEQATTGLPRVLVVSHNPFSDTQNNGKTLSAFFQGWPKDRIAQLYFTLDEPSLSVCERYFRITDLDMLMKALHRPAKWMGEIHPDAIPAASAEKAQVHRSPVYRLIRDVFQARTPLALLVRSAFWRPQWWNTAELQAWLGEFGPEVVFFQSSNSTFAFDIIESICASQGIPLVMETTDDYVTLGRSFSPFAVRHHRRIQRAYQTAVGHASSVIAIGDKMAREYRRRFGGQWSMAMNSVEPVAPDDQPEPTDDPKLLIFAGNVGLNRWQVLAAIGQALKQLDEQEGIRAKLVIYSLQEPTGKVAEALNIPGYCEFGGAKDSDFLAEQRGLATLLVHVESFDKRNRAIARLSVSTKIPEYMAADRCILAVGPADVASIEYLVDNDAAQVITSSKVDDIVSGLRQALTDAPGRARRRRNALDLVRRNHLRPVIQQQVREAILEAVARR